MQQHCLNGIKVAIKRLEDFWNQQKMSWKEIRDISDEEICSPDLFFNQDIRVVIKQSLPTILENEEEQDSNIQKEIEVMWSLVNRLRDAETKIVERYKMELKSLALELKSEEEKCFNHEDEKQELFEQLKEFQSLSHKQRIDRKQYMEKGIQTEEEKGNLQVEHLKMLYDQEKQKAYQLESIIKEQQLKYADLQILLKQQKSIVPQSQEGFDDQFKRDLTVELQQLKNKINILTDQANQAEELLIEKDSQVRDFKKQFASLQQELTQKRAFNSSVKEEKKTIENTVKFSQSVNRKLDAEVKRLNQLLQQKDQECRQFLMNERKEDKNARSVALKQMKEDSYKSFTIEIQQLTQENQNLRSQLQTCQKQLKAQLDGQVQQRKGVQNQQDFHMTEIEELRHRNHEQSIQIDELQKYKQHYNQDYIDEKISENLNEAMEYLELKDMEIDKLRQENDRLKNHSEYQGKQPHPYQHVRQLFPKDSKYTNQYL